MRVITNDPRWQNAFPRPTARQWLIFAIQALLVTLADASNDIFRGNILPPNSSEAMHNAREVVGFEAGHGFFIEPALQSFFHHGQHLLGLTITWAAVEHVANNVYAFCHIFVTLAVCAWVYAFHRDRFPLVRNLMLFTNAVAAAVYEIFPMAPPRLTAGLSFDHHPFHFQDTMQHVIGSGKLNGVPIGYNPFSAMPSLHVAWAIIIGVTVVLLARQPLMRLLGAIYPGVMVMTVVVTGNHYLMDAIGAALVVAVALVPALAVERARRSRRCAQQQTPQPVTVQAA
jgi:PAP2 superfamily